MSKFSESIAQSYKLAQAQYAMDSANTGAAIAKFRNIYISPPAVRLPLLSAVFILNVIS
jgi:hypothetical protein